MTTRRGNHEGSAPRQRSDGRWQVNVRHVDSDGKSKRVSVYGKTRAEVQRKARDVRARLEADQPVKDSTQRLGDYAKAWTTSTLAASDRKDSTKALYAMLVRKHICGSDLGRMALAKVKPMHVEAWVAGLRAKGLAESTVRSTYTVLRAVLDTAVRDEHLATNPVAKVKRPKVTSEDARYLTPAEVASLVSALDGSRYQPLVRLLVATGLRRGEALALRWSNVDLTNGTARITGTLSRTGGDLVVTPTKTDRSRRTVHLAESTVTVLRSVKAAQARERLKAGDQWADGGYVFTTELGHPLDPRNALRAIQTAATRAGLEGVRLHTLRHTAASLMLSAGVGLKIVSDILGHASISVTADTYGHLQPDVTKTAMATLDAALNGPRKAV